MKIPFELVYSVKETALPIVGRYQSLHLGPAWSKKWSKKRLTPLLLAYLLKWGHLILPRPALKFVFIPLGSRGSQIFRLRLELYHQFSWVHSFQRPDHGTSQPP